MIRIGKIIDNKLSLPDKIYGTNMYVLHDCVFNTFRYYQSLIELRKSLCLTLKNNEPIFYVGVVDAGILNTKPVWIFKIFGFGFEQVITNNKDWALSDGDDPEKYFNIFYENKIDYEINVD